MKPIDWNEPLETVVEQTHAAVDHAAEQSPADAAREEAELEAEVRRRTWRGMREIFGIG